MKIVKPLDLKLNLLVLRAQVGDEEAFKELHFKYSISTLRLLQSYMNGTEAQDLNQEVWLKVYLRIASLTNTAGFKTWLFQITRNMALDNFRASKRINEFFDMLKSESEYNGDIDENDFLIGNFQLLEEAVEELSPKLREAIVLKYFEGMDMQEISLIMGCSLGTVKSRLHNAKNVIKKLYNDKT